MRTIQPGCTWMSRSVLYRYNEEGTSGTDRDFKEKEFRPTGRRTRRESNAGKRFYRGQRSIRRHEQRDGKLPGSNHHGRPRPPSMDGRHHDDARGAQNLNFPQRGIAGSRWRSVILWLPWFAGLGSAVGTGLFDWLRCSPIHIPYI